MIAVVDYGAGNVQSVLNALAAIQAPVALTNDPAAILAAEGRMAPCAGARGGYVATDGWTATSDTPAAALIGAMRARGVRKVVYTDIARDGTLSSPNVAAIRQLAALGVEVVAAGGVARSEHLRELAAIPGVTEAIVGRALYTGDVEPRGAGWTLEPLTVTDGAA